jgi:hypothetical protein
MTPQQEKEPGTAMYYDDLTSYEYYLPFKLPNVLNVGWLATEHAFAKADAPAGLLDRLRQILRAEGNFSARVNPIRGIHPCHHCGARQFQHPHIGSCEIWIPSQKAENYFAAPSLIIHYIEEHNYIPPQNFIDAVFQVDTTVHFDGQTVYDNLVQARMPAA